MNIPKAKRIEIKKADRSERVFVSIISERKIDTDKLEGKGLVKLQNIDNVIKLNEFKWVSSGGGFKNDDSNGISGYASNIEYINKEELPQELI